MQGRVGGGKGKPWDGELVPTAVAGLYPAFSHLPASYLGIFGPPDGHLSPGRVLLLAGGWVGLGQQEFSSSLFHVSSVTGLSPGATPAPSMWAPSPGLGAALFQARSPSCVLGPGFMLPPHAHQDL